MSTPQKKRPQEDNVRQVQTLSEESSVNSGKVEDLRLRSRKRLTATIAAPLLIIALVGLSSDPAVAASGILLVSHDPFQSAAAGNSSYPSMSSDGRFVAFESDAATLVPNDTNGATDIFRWDRQTDQIARVIVDS